jgi:hypothetical protein
LNLPSDFRAQGYASAIALITSILPFVIARRNVVQGNADTGMED